MAGSSSSSNNNSISTFFRKWNKVKGKKLPKKKKTEIDPKKQIISAKDGFNRTLLIIINKCGTRKENEENPLE